MRRVTDLGSDVLSLVLDFVPSGFLFVVRSTCSTFRDATGSDLTESEVGSYCSSPRLLSWAKSKGCDWNEWTCFRVASKGNLACLQHARRLGCPWNMWTPVASAWRGDAASLLWARREGAPVNHCLTTQAAAARGHLHVLKLLYRQGVLFDDVAWAGAAVNGRVAVLRWMYKKVTSSAASARGEGQRPSCRSFSSSSESTEIPCVVPCVVYNSAVRGKQERVVRWAARRGCPLASLHVQSAPSSPAPFFLHAVFLHT